MEVWDAYMAGATNKTSQVWEYRLEADRKKEAVIPLKKER